uniref:Uncharacterized protein n=1 Tax=uncultured marine virus TaxID=186617 RepID=A0A0F7L888_9VIRU|nr:hypothetical protein [uncultured marine virus]
MSTCDRRGSQHPPIVRVPPVAASRRPVRTSTRHGPIVAAPARLDGAEVLAPPLAAGRVPAHHRARVAGADAGSDALGVCCRLELRRGPDVLGVGLEVRGSARVGGPLAVAARAGHPHLARWWAACGVPGVGVGHGVTSARA